MVGVNKLYIMLSWHHCILLRTLELNHSGLLQQLVGVYCPSSCHGIIAFYYFRVESQWTITTVSVSILCAMLSWHHCITF